AAPPSPLIPTMNSERAPEQPVARAFRFQILSDRCRRRGEDRDDARRASPEPVLSPRGRARPTQDEPERARETKFLASSRHCGCEECRPRLPGQPGERPIHTEVRRGETPGRG